MIVDYKKINDIRTDAYKEYFRYDSYDFPLDETHHFSESRASSEHYRLLTYISKLFDNISILDVGTNWGESAVSLSQNNTNKIISYDIKHIWNFPFTDKIHNIEFKLMDIKNEDVDIIKNAKVIFLDIAHDGIQERAFTDMLSDIGYKGYLLCDDIHLPWEPLMEKWWNSISIDKYDLSDIGHTWGTGLVNYSGQNIEIIK